MYHSTFPEAKERAALARNPAEKCYKSVENLYNSAVRFCSSISRFIMSQGYSCGSSGFSLSAAEYQLSLQRLKEALKNRDTQRVVALSQTILHSDMPARQPRVFASYCLIRGYTLRGQYSNAQKAALIALQKYPDVASLHYALASTFLAQINQSPQLLIAARYSLLDALKLEPQQPLYVSIAEAPKDIPRLRGDASARPRRYRPLL